MGKKTLGKGFLATAFLLAAVCFAGCGEGNSVSSAGLSSKASASSAVTSGTNNTEGGVSTDIVENHTEGPLVIVTFEKKDGKTVREEVSFSEDLEFFTVCEEPWTLDLNGQDIVVGKEWRIATEGKIVNGKLSCGKDAYILNEGKLQIGSKDQYAYVYLTSEGTGIENKGELTLGYLDITVKNGRGIVNKGTLKAVRESKTPHVVYETEGGVILENDGEALIYAADLMGTGETYIENNSVLYLFGADFDGKCGVFVLNEPDKELYLYDTSFVVDYEGEIGVKNHGTVKKCEAKEGCSSRNSVSVTIKVSGGTGIENSGEWLAQGKINLIKGTGIHNKSTKEFTEEYKWIFMDQEGGTGLLNDGTFGYVKINAVGGEPIVNSGNLIGEVRVNAVSERFKGTLVHNEATGVVSANVYVNTGSLNEAKIIENLGTFSGKGLYRNSNIMIYGGLKIDSLRDWFSVTGLSRINYSIAFNEKSNNSCFVYNGGKIKDYDLDANIFGEGDDYSVLKTENGTESMFTNEASVIVAGSGITAVDIGEGSMVNFEFATITSDISLLFAIEGIAYEKSDSNSQYIHDNVLMINRGTIGLTKAQSRLYFKLLGKNSRGFVNKGHIEGYELLVEVGGEENIGLLNTNSPQVDYRMSMNLDTLTVRVKEIGGNTGAINEGLITCSYLYGQVNTEEDVKDELGRQDTGFINDADGQIECTEYVGAFCNNSNCVGIENRNNLKCGKSLYIDGNHGTGMVCEKKSFTSTEKLNVDLKNEAGDATGLITYDLIEVTDGLYISAKGENNFGVLIMSGGSISQTFAGEYMAADVRSEKHGHAVVNEGRLYLERPYFTKEQSGAWDEVLSNHGQFNYSWLYDKSYYDEHELLGPWKGIGYGIFTDQSAY